jgi:hypothetical protein
MNRLALNRRSKKSPGERPSKSHSPAMANDKNSAELEHDEFMRRAKFCVEFAETLADSEIRTLFLQMAARWKQLADEAKTRGR